jgi:hypothetical protein
MRLVSDPSVRRSVAAGALLLAAAFAGGCGESQEPAEDDGSAALDEEYDEPEDEPEPSPRKRQLGGPAPVPRAQPLPPVKPEPEEPLPEEAGPVDLDRLFARMETLFPVARERPSPTRWRDEPDEKAGLAAAKAYADAKRRWKEAVEELVLLARRYERAAEGVGGTQSVVRFYEGFARLELARTQTRAKAATQREKAVAALEAYLNQVAADDPYRADATNLLVQAYAFTSGDHPERADKAAELLPEAVDLLLAEGRQDEAAVSISYVCKPLLARGREGGDTAALDRLAELAEKLEFETRDYGEATPRFVAMARATRVRPGLELPELPDVKDVDGAPLRLADLRGSVVVLHFFKTDHSERTREIEAHLRPLWEAWNGKGLEMVGISIDWEMPEEFLERRKRDWERDEMDMSKLRDGKLESVRAWAEQRGVEWRWFWDGKWLGNAVADHYGVPLNRAWAILVDREGVIVWCGEPYKLKEPLELLLQG